MKLIKQNITQSLSNIKILLNEKSLAKKLSIIEPPLRAELFSADQMEQHGKTLASSHVLGIQCNPETHLLKRLADNEAFLFEVHGLLTETIRAKHQITPAGEWLLDNFYFIEMQIKTGKRHLPKSYSLELPCLLNGPSKGLPRVYDIAKENIAHGDGRVDPENLIRFVTAYQTITPLKLGELWAIPTMLRLALIENLRRVAVLVAARRLERDLANLWADRLIETAEKDPKNLIIVIADMARTDPPMTTPFVSELARRLQGLSHTLVSPLAWIEQRLSESGLTIEKLIQTGIQQQAANQISISNSIGSLRFLESMDWRQFVETISTVERILFTDPGNAYGNMDFLTRDHYRHVIEKIAKRSSLSEEQVAASAINLAQESAVKMGSSNRTAHVGFYLIDKGLKQLEDLVKVKFSAAAALKHLINRIPFPIYISSIIIITILLTLGLLLKLNIGDLSLWSLGLLSILFLLCTSQLSIALVNWLFTLLVKPQPLPKMDYSEGIPPEQSTLVVIPAILMNSQNVIELIESLEVRFLANRDDNLHFSLLTDFKDSAKESMPEDEELVSLACTKIQELNIKYKSSHKNSFFLFHRPRQWNPGEGKWMGYERKRGKLEELNSMIRRGKTNRFSHIVGNTDLLPGMKYIITLDTDTLLPRDSAHQLVGAMAHPLNRAYYNKDKKRFTDGYSVLQPRIAVSLPEVKRSRYARLFGSQPGIDPYTRTVSDIYQDIFSEGSFIGKGIYDIEIFDQVFNGRFPENQILSHDLLEGCYTRAGLLSDIMLFEEYPSRYYEDVNRRHRWIRGDWQLLHWLLPVVPGPKRGLQKNPLSGLSQWKLLDNLRRSLIPMVLMVLLLLGWIILPEAWFWTLAAAGVILIPAIVISILDLFKKPADILISHHLTDSMRSAGMHLAQAAFTLITLPYEAFFSQDAIIRTIWRMLISRKRLLEWNPSNIVKRGGRSTLLSSYKTMWISPFITIFIIVFFVVSKQTLPLISLPLLFLWTASPAIIWWISLPRAEHEIKLTSNQKLFLRELSRKTWSYFETFVGPADNWLPPDNYQENVEVIAHRTSPTNMGLALLANLTAYDFGYITAGQFIDRTSNTFRTMETLERYQGHFYNWYDTKSLSPLRPFYISSVDSGNLAGHLITLRQGFLELPDQKIISLQLFNGISDTLRILLSVVKGSINNQLKQFQKDLESILISPPFTLEEMLLSLENLAALSAKLDINIIEPESEAVRWAHSLNTQCRTAIDELLFLAPWIKTPAFKIVKRYFHLNNIPTLNELAKFETEFWTTIRLTSNPGVDEDIEMFDELTEMIKKTSINANKRITAIKNLAKQSAEFSRMEYNFLYNKARHLISIGYNIEDKRRDSSYYDLLASEARLSTFIAIAQGNLPQESWFALGRLLTTAAGEPILLSWSGSMFEYLMPLLVMPTYENTLLDQTNKTVVKRQIEYGKQRNVPWGISESCYNTVDVNLNYQYRAFGVPGLGLKRGLAEDLVVAPYASALALMIDPEEACNNLQKLASEGLIGRYGFYEAIDYTTQRLPRDQSKVVIKSFMSHHGGMILLSLSYLLLNRPMQKRFISDPLIEATVLLLQERIPKTSFNFLDTSGLTDTHIGSDNREMPVRTFTNPDTPIPEVQFLSNGRYNVMITNSGGGYSKWKDIALTRWREDSTCDNWGTFCYIRDLDSGEFWSTAYQPTLKRSKHFEAIFSEGHAEFRRRDKDFDIHTEVIVSPEDDIELRRIHLTNNTRIRKRLDITSYAEIVLASSASDMLHPAFSNLFVQTEIIFEQHAILCTRRPRSPEDQKFWILHMMTVRGASIEEVSFETDRAQFIGRGNTIIAPEALKNAGALSNSQGSVLDPIVAIRYYITMEPEETATIDMIFGIGETRDIALNLIEKYQDRRLANRAFELAWTHSQVVLRQINATEADTQLYVRLASSIIYANSFRRANQNVILKNYRGQSGLWGYSISGDLPIVLLQIEDPANIDLVSQMVQAHAYWRLKGLAVDLVIWNEDYAGYRQQLQEQIMRLIAAGVEANYVDRPGGIFIRQADQISIEDRVLIQTVARVIISDRNGSLESQVNKQFIREIPVHRFKRISPYHASNQVDFTPSGEDLIFFNGIGGFTHDGREYIIATSEKQITPAPWVNVIANPNFGTIVTENGPNYTWNENAHEFRLTPWNNDPVTDSSGEAFYIRDEETGHFWSPTPLPCRGVGYYKSRHGFGYSVYEHTEGGIRSELWIYVAIDASIKFSVLKIRNDSGMKRKLSATGYVELVLGDLRGKTAMHVITEINSENNSIYARNSYNSEFAKRITFFQTDAPFSSFTCDRTEFLGRNGTLRNPAVMNRSHLSGKTGAALDPCAAINVTFDLDMGEEREIIFRLGAGINYEETGKLIQRYNGSLAARNALESVWQYWKHTLGAVQVDTPDPSLNVLINGWLLYQTLACRIWARSGFYQSGGAFGFRDQLQDVMALIHSEPGMIRKHLLLCASRQFKEGDVQHWWHPPSGRGVRTHCSDDYLWLPFVTCRYVLSTGDTGILDESVNFLEGRLVNPEEDSYYDLPNRSDETESLYQHCVRAITKALVFGEHGLPLIGTGDWNDGMNTVGNQGKGESVWLGFFLYEILMQFIKIADKQGDVSLVERCRNEAFTLRQNLELNGWDGNWYRRAYFDDGTPLGSEINMECKIDSIVQSWSVLSSAGEVIHSRQAMDALNKHLVRSHDRLIQLLNPPFDKSELNPGYIKGYVPGVRENGGQYTHAAIWAGMAFAALRENQHAWEVMEIINPINHTKSQDGILKYKVEPYVVAADVYALTPHTGRGGWTWYTGSAGWLYRFILESLLGLKLEIDKLTIEPCLPADWKTYQINYRFRETTYNISIVQIFNDYNNITLTVDGLKNDDKSITLINDHQVHTIEVRLLKLAPSN